MAKSFSNCIKTLVNSGELSQAMADDLAARAATYARGGYSAKDAHEMAVSDALQEQRDDLAAVYAQIGIDAADDPLLGAIAGQAAEPVAASDTSPEPVAETPPSELVAAGATTDNHVARAIKATKDFLDKFNDSPRELKEQRKFTAAAESKFGIDKIAGYRGGFTVHVNDRSDGNATVYMQSPTGDFVTTSTIPLSDTAVYRTDQETPPSEQGAGADQDSLTSDQETLTAGRMNMRHTVKMADILTPAGAIKADARNGAGRIWYHQGDPNAIQFAAKVTVGGKPAPEWAVKEWANLSKANDLGYRLRNLRAGSLGTVWILHKDGRVLTKDGFDAINRPEFAAPVREITDSGYDNMLSGQATYATRLAEWFATLPESTLQSASALATKIGQTPIGEWASIARDRNGEVRFAFKASGGKLDLYHFGGDTYADQVRMIIALAGEAKNKGERAWFQIDFAAKEKAKQAKEADTPLRDFLAEYGFVATQEETAALTEADRVPIGDPAKPAVFDVATDKGVVEVYAESSAEAERVAQEHGLNTGPYTLAEHTKLMDAMKSGTLSLADYQAAFRRAKDGQEALRAEFAAMTKDKIMKTAGIGAHYRNEAKDRLVRMAVDEVLDDFDPREAKTWTMGTDRHGHIAKVTQEDLDAYADRRRQRLEALMAERLATMEGIDNPQTLDDYQNYIRAKKLDGMTFADARMTLTPEQRATYDELLATQTRDARQDRADQQKTAVQVAAKTTEGQIVQTKHTRTGQDLFVVKAAERVERDVYNQWSATARRMGGWYSSFKGNGAVPGFQFKTMQDAEAFLQYLGGDVAAAKEQVQERRDAFDDDKSQSAVDRLREMADAMESAADESLSVERKSNTARRARFAAAAEAGANEAKAMAQTMRNIAQAIEDGSAKFLDRVRTKVQIQMLNSMVGSAQWEYWRKKYPSYAEQEKHKGERPIPEVADYVKFPYYTAYRSDLARLGRELLQSDGTKKLGQRLLSVADDVTDTYLEFAKANFHRVSTFSLSGGGQAWFKNREQAEEAIKRSGLKGKAIVLPVKRGQNAIIQSPTFARENGIWEGDDDKQISLESSFGAELVAKANEYKRPPFSIPYYFHGIAEKQARLKAMGIETPAEFRAMLREFIGMKQAPKAPDRVKELERAMAGKRNTDGLDFFPTPASTAQAMIDAAGLEPDMRVLEPSAGMGHIADMIRDAGVEPDVVEMANDRKEFLEAKGFNVVGRDFMEIKARAGFTYGDLFRAPDGTVGIMQGSGGMGSDRVMLVDPTTGKGINWFDRDTLEGIEHRKTGYDRIIMNPPFSNRRDAEHVRHAYTLLAPGGRIVAIMGEGSFFGQDKKAQEFRDWLESVGGTSEKLDEGTFFDPSLPVNTGVNARMVVIDKPAAGLESRGAGARWYYSALESGLRDKMPEKLRTQPAQQWALWLRSNFAKIGAKREELEWSGVLDYLALRGKGKVTAAELADWVAGNGVQVRDTILEEGRPAYPNDDGTKFDQYAMPGGENYKELLITLPSKPLVEFDPSKVKIQRHRQSVTQGAVTLLYDGQPLGRRYNDEGTASENYMRPESYWMGVAKKLFEEGEQTPDGRRLSEARTGSDNFRSSHFDKPNILAHIRMNERTDADGARVLFLEELQSDWGQKGKREGFKSEYKGRVPTITAKVMTGREFVTKQSMPEAAAKFWLENRNAVRADLQKPAMTFDDVVTVIYEDGIPKIVKDGALDEDHQVHLHQARYEKMVAEAKRDHELNQVGRAPSAPFVGDTKAWTGLALKRAIAYAVDNGFDKIAWTTGRQQIERYPDEIRKVADYIEWDTSSDGKGVLISKAGSVIMRFGVDGKGIIGRSTVGKATGKSLEEVIGKDMAAKVLESDSGEIEGKDFTVGGKGMEGYYDAIVPQVAKKLGAQVGTVNLESYNDKGWGTLSEGIQEFGLNQPGFTITDAMREQVSSNGLPLFSERKPGSPAIAAERARYQAVVDKFVKRFKGAAALDIRLVATRSEIPERYRPSPFAEGVYHSGIGTVWLITDNLTPARANQVLLHETIGHYGLASMMGERFSGLLPSVKRVARAKATLVDDTLQPGDADYATWEAVKLRYPEASESELAQEVLARMAETEPDASMLAYVRAVVRKWLRDVARALGVDLDVSATELNDLLILAAAHVRRGDNLATGTIAPEVVAASKSPTVAQTETPEFKRWFGDSKVVDADGRPLVVYHGTKSDVESFDPDAIDQDEFGQGFYFTEFPNVANRYARSEYSLGGNVMPVYLAIRNPAVVRGAFADGDLYVLAGVNRRSELTKALKEKGYDGVIRETRYGKLEIVAFYPEQIKSAIGNNGNFDPSNPSILESRAAQSALPLAGGQSAAQSAWDIDPDTRLTRLIYRFQDKHVDTKALVKAIEESRGQATPDSFDPYLGEELYHKRTAARVDAFADGELKPLLNAMRLAGVGREEFEQYLHARHAQEANQLIRDRDGMDDGGSGMFDAEAQAYLSGLDPAKRLTYERLARQVDAIIAKTRQTLVDYGLESQDTIDAWARMFQHYVPLNREDMETGTGIGQGFSVRGPASKSRTGSSRQVVDILANIAQQRDRAIVRGEKNRVATALYGLAYLNPNKDVWQAGIVPTKQVVVDGKIATVPDHNYKNEPNVIVARIKDRKGQVHDRAIIFNRHNERAMRLAGAMKNLDAPQMGELMNAAGKITRYLSAINTQYNPVFVFVNLMRDVQGAMFNLSSTPLAGMQTEVAGHTASALRGIFSDLRAHRAGQQPSSVWAQLYEEMQREGGTTGYRDMFGTAQERSAEQIDKLLDPDWWAKTKWGKALTAGGILKAPEEWLVSKPGKALFNLLSDANETSENAIRLAVYKTAIDHGMSKARAASLSKNITVNFNRKGQLGSQMNAFYAFFNAAVQGTARLAETLRSPAGKQIMAGGVLLGMVQALALAAAFDDDDPPDFVRERNLIIPLGGKRYATIPLPLGLHVLPNVGRIPMELVLRGFKKPGKAATDFLSVFAEAFNPIGNAGMSWQTLTPSVIDPAVALLENKDWSGRPIARQSFDKNEPGHLRTKDTASPFSKAAARFINAATGGTEYTAGALSPSPDQLDYLIGQATGGVGREASKAFQTAGAMISGEDLPPYKVPLLGRVFGKAEGKSHEGNRFYANLDEVDRAAKELKGRRVDGGDSGEYAREHPEAFLGSLASRTKLRLTMLRRQKEKAMEAGNREAVKAVEEQMTQAMLAFNERYDAVTKETSTAD